MGRWNDGKLEYWNGWPTIKAVLYIASLQYSNIPVFQRSSIPTFQSLNLPSSERYNSSPFCKGRHGRVDTCNVTRGSLE